MIVRNQNGMAARREAQSIHGLLASRVTQRTPVRPRRAEQVPSGLPDGCDPGAGCRAPIKRVLVRTCTVASPNNMAPLLHAPVRAATRRDGTSFRDRRCCSVLVWTGQTSSLAPSRSSKIVSIAHVNDDEIGSSAQDSPGPWVR